MPRKAMTKEAKIKRALYNGIAVNEIARRYRTSPQYVNLIKRKMGSYTVQAQPHEHIVGPLPAVPAQPAQPAQPEKEAQLFATGIVSLHPVPDTPQPTIGIMAIPPGAGEVRELEGPPKPTLWQRFKLWAWGRA